MFSYSNFDYQFLTTPQQIADIFPTGNPPDFWGICFFFPRQERISWWTPCATDIRILDVG